MKLIFATSNSNKVKEINGILKGGDWRVESLADIGIYEDIAETGKTLEENALIKARYVYQKTGLSVFSEDTGLEILTLNNQPGVRSARYAGDRSTSSQNIDLVLKQLANKKDRRARFRTIIALIINGKEHLFEGLINGKISFILTGEGGFGYDPIFIPESYNISFAQMTSAEKNKISHRYKAVHKMTKFLLNQT